MLVALALDRVGEHFTCVVAVGQARAAILPVAIALHARSRHAGVDLDVLHWLLSEPVNSLYRAVRWLAGTYDMTEI